MPKIFCSVKAIIQDKDKFLALKYVEKNFTIWDLPGGRINYGENPYEALRREVKEETNLDIKIIRPMGMFWFFRPKTKDQIICTTFVCQAKNTKVDITKNVAEENFSDYRWVTKNEFLTGEEYSTCHESLKKLISQL